MTPPEAKAAAMLASPDDIEAQFYEALQQGDIVRLMAAWADDEDVVCVHPGGPRVVGPAAVRGELRGDLRQRGHPGPDRRRAPPRGRRGAPCTTCSSASTSAPTEGTQTAWVVATNVYVKTAQGWRLAAHHASASASLELPDLDDLPTTLH